MLENDFTKVAMADMHFIHTYPIRVFTCAKTFRTLLTILCETGKLNKNAGGRKSETETTRELEEAILETVGDRWNSIRKIALQFRDNPKTI